MSKTKNKSKTMAIFIDGNNFRHGLRALLQSEDIHWKTFKKLISKDYDVIYINYYIGKVTSPLFAEEKVEQQAKLIKYMHNAGMNTWMGYFNEQKSEKGVDVQIALDLVVGAIEKHFDTALLISGDGDLANAVKIAQHYGTRVILGYVAGIKNSNYRISWRLKDKTDAQAALNKQILESHKKVKKKGGQTKKTTPKTSKKKQENNNSTDLELLLFSDGGSRGNPGPAGCGAVITSKNGKVLKKLKKYLGKTTNNQAEYQALLLGLKQAQKMQPKQLTCYLDSKLIVEQVNGRWKVKKKELKPHHAKVLEYLLKNPNTSFHHIPRNKNKLADQLANEAMDKKK